MTEPLTDFTVNCRASVQAYGYITVKAESQKDANRIVQDKIDSAKNGYDIIWPVGEAGYISTTLEDINFETDWHSIDNLLVIDGKDTHDEV